MRLCTNCQFQNKDKFLICQKCGASLTNQNNLNVQHFNVQPVTSSTQTAPPVLVQKPKIPWHKKPLTYVIAGIVVLSIAAVIYSNIAFNDRMAKVKDAIKAEDYSTAQTMLDEEITTNGTQGEVYLIYSDYYIAQGLYSEAVEILEKGEKSASSTDKITERLDSVKTEYASEIEAAKTKLEQEKQERETQLAKEKAEAEANQAEADKESKRDYIATCKTVTWKDVARDPDAYKGQKIIVTGEVSQIMSGGWFSNGGCRLYEDYDIMSGDSWLQKEWYISVDTDKVTPRILKDDIVTFYGEFTGTTEIKRALTGAKDTVPTMKVSYYTINE